MEMHTAAVILLAALFTYAAWRSSVRCTKPQSSQRNTGRDRHLGWVICVRGLARPPRRSETKAGLRRALQT
jgi:hypothetical protein